jgi:acid phosphatase type 7
MSGEYATKEQPRMSVRSGRKPAIHFALICASLLSRLPVLAADKLVGGPFVVHVGPRSATVVWIVETGSASLGTEPGKAEKSVPVLRAEKVTYPGLKPGTTYYYDVLGRDEGRGSFKTAPLGTADFQFVVYGDNRTRHDVHRRVMAAVVKHGTPDFALQSGDMVENGADSSLWPVFFDIERELLSKTAFFPTLGNHERNNRLYYEFFDQALPYYSFDWGQAHFSIMNSDIGNSAASSAAKASFWAEQTRWLEDDLAKSQDAAFRFVLAHHPPITAVTRRQGDNPEMIALMPLFEKQHVTAGLFGHDHNYQHYLKNGVHYVISGGGGAPLYDVDKPPAGITQKVASTENFVWVKVTGKSAHVEAYTPDGSTIDRFDLNQ